MTSEAKSDQPSKLMRRLDGYPGGLTALAQDTGRSRQTLYDALKGRRRRIPWGVLGDIATFVAEHEGCDAGALLDELARLWVDEFG